MLSQDVLRHHLALRVAEAEAGLGGEPIVPTEPVDLEVLASAPDRAPNVAAVAVLRRFEPAAFARSALEFALAAGGERRDEWFRAFTRTIFLNGNPENIANRFPFTYLASDRSVAWFGPATPKGCVGLLRLLKLFVLGQPPDPPAEVTITVPGAPSTGRMVRVYLATSGLQVSDYLVHLNHTLAEAVLTGAVLPGDRLLLSHVPTLAASQIGAYRRLRVHRDDRDPTRLRAYACVTEPSTVDESATPGSSASKEKTDDDGRSPDTQPGHPPGLAA
jgi:hypothetical protein